MNHNFVLFFSSLCYIMTNYCIQTFTHQLACFFFFLELIDQFFIFWVNTVISYSKTDAWAHNKQAYDQAAPRNLC